MTKNENFQLSLLLLKFNLHPKEFFTRLSTIITPGRRQSKTLFTIDKCVSKIDRNSVFDCHLSPVGRLMTIENSVSNDL